MGNKNKKKENQQLNEELFKLKNLFDIEIEKERKRIDILCNDIKNKFNEYFEKLKNECSTIISKVPELKCRIFEENDIATPFKIEIGKIEVEPIQLKFIRGYKE